MKHAVTVRLLIPQDEVLFKGLITEYVKEYMRKEKTYPVHFDENIGGVYLKEITESAKDYVVVVAQSEEKLVGFCIGEIHHFGEIETTYFVGDRRGELWDLYVKADFRSREIGRKMLAVLEKECVKRGCQHMVLRSVDKDNEEAQKLYERLGYKVWTMTYYKALN